MKAIPTPLRIRWLSAAGGAPVRAGAERHASIAIPAPPSAGLDRGEMEMLDLALGMQLCRVAHRFARGQAGLRAMSEVATELPEPVLFVQSARSGRGVLQDAGLKVRLEHDPAVCVFAHLDHIDHRHWAETGAPLEVTALTIGASTLQRSLGEPAAHALLAALGILRAPSASRRPLPPPITALLHGCLTDRFTANLRTLQAQARVLDFLVALTDHMVGVAQPEPGKLRSIRQLRGELDPWHESVPDLEALARGYGLSVRAMNEGFKREYGQSIHACLSDLRLFAAHAALQSDGLSLKVLAARLGYADVSHFSNAFTKKFGYRPGGVRRERWAEAAA
ncbi:helix-turn-helix transcriptional regulator [uncultured Thiodictyon sp.]|jgi:AraC-like DNA-binding protein|uniref:helix-turn-helix domain-containing protein n=1 Tax=uncultured Thiodictyon sp. TaxID=1846217 RepID=UPI0025E3591B|nr:helix-turn-helix transcriptional regulator [uncultured Thiodictyon sp.]